MSVLLQLSDTHFGCERPEITAALLEFATSLAPDLVVLSGGVTEHARPREFAVALDFIDRLPDCERLIVPGNQDIPRLDVATRLVAPFRTFRSCFGHRLEETVMLPDVLVTGVNSVCRWRHKGGALLSAQIKAVGMRLRRARPDQLRVVVVHHPLDVPDDVSRGDIVGGAEAAVKAWAMAGADLILTGHVHAPLCRPLSARYGMSAGRCWTAAAGTAVSAHTRGGHPNSVNVIRHSAAGDGAGTVLEQHDFDEASGAFRLVASQALPL